MRRLNDTETERLEYLAKFGVEVSLLEVTDTGLRKSIMDATKPVRDYLRDEGLHDYSSQAQGPSNKRMVTTDIFTEDRVTRSQTSLYRPETKSGDPRLWIYNITNYCQPNDILALVKHDGILKVFNLTRLNIISQGNSTGAFNDFLNTYAAAVNATATELLAKMRVVAAKGYIRSDVDADTAIGRLLETELGIRANSSKQPDYKGIEIKSYRSGRTNRKNLFAQVPDWSMSKFKSSKQILDAFGYDRDGVRKLYVQVDALRANPQGLKLVVDDTKGLLIEQSEDASIGGFIVWQTETLRKRLTEKHAETFWVEADEKREANVRYFKFTKVEHTRGPLAPQLEVLIKNGQITMDHLIKEKGRSAVEKGPLFKIHHRGLPLLFPPSSKYEL